MFLLQLHRLLPKPRAAMPICHREQCIDRQPRETAADTKVVRDISIHTEWCRDAPRRIQTTGNCSGTYN